MGIIELLIVGAGPAGIASGLQAKKMGNDPLLIDKAVFPRDKICGDALSGKVVQVLNRLDPAITQTLRQQPIQLPSWGVTFRAPNGKALDIPFKSDYQKESDQAPGMISRRMDFDYFMVKEGRKRGLEIREGTEAINFERKDGIWEISTRSGEIIRTRLLIIANGAQSQFARQAGITKDPAHNCAGLRAYFHGIADPHPDHFIELYFSKTFLPGYFWIFPLPDGYFNVGVGMRSDKLSKKKINLKVAMQRMIKEDPHLRDRFRHAKQIGEIRGYGLPLGSKRRGLSGDGFLLAGDAASLIDPFTGEGIGNAMLSGVEAGKVAATAIEKNDVSAVFLKKYDENVYRQLGPELNLSYKLQQLVQFPWLFNLVVGRAAKSETLRHTISCMFEDLDLRSQLKKPGFYRDLIFK